MKKQEYHFWIFLSAFYGVWVVRATWFYSRVDLALLDPSWRMVFSNAIKFVLWVLPAVAYLMWHDRQNLLTSMKIATHIDRRGLLIGIGVSSLYFVFIFTFTYLSSHQTLASLLRAAPLTILITLASVFFSPLSEELLFRGFILPKISEKLGFWPANLLQAFLFTAIHWPNWVWLGGFHANLVASSAGVFLLGLLFGWLAGRTNSIWPPVAVHIINNFLTAFLR